MHTLSCKYIESILNNNFNLIFLGHVPQIKAINETILKVHQIHIVTANMQIQSPVHTPSNVKRT